MVSTSSTAQIKLRIRYFESETSMSHMNYLVGISDWCLFCARRLFGQTTHLLYMDVSAMTVKTMISWLYDRKIQLWSQKYIPLWRIRQVTSNDTISSSIGWIAVPLPPKTWRNFSKPQGFWLQIMFLTGYTFLIKLQTWYFASETSMSHMNFLVGISDWCFSGPRELFVLTTHLLYMD